MEIKFSLHAYERVLGRISMTHKDLADLIEADLVVDIGQDNNSNRVHKLFYSYRDKMCFVAIQDVKSNTVVTVLPIDYHENISWAVSIESQNQAKRLVTEDACDFEDLKILNTNASVFRISGMLADKYGRYIKTINLASYPCLPYRYSIDALVKDKTFLDFLVENIKQKASAWSDTSDHLHTILIRLGSKGEPVCFSPPEQNFSE